MKVQMGRVDHLAWVVRHENLEAYVAKLSALFETTFDLRDSPNIDGIPIQAYVSWDSGLELISPYEHPNACPVEDHPLAKRLADHLEKRGEGIFGIIVRVPNVEGAVGHARELGWEPQETGPHPSSADDRRAVNARWTSKIGDLQEHFIGEFLDTQLIVGEVEYPEESG